MRTVYSILAACILMSGCACEKSEPKNCTPLTQCEENPVGAKISEIVILFSKNLEETHKLFLYNSRAIFDGTIKKIRVDYTSQKSVELCEAREILVDIVEGLLSLFDAELFWAFKDGTVTPQELEIHVNFTSYFNKYVDPSYTSYIILQNSESFFYTSELDYPFTDAWMQKVEPYYKTKQFVTFSREAECVHKEEGDENTKKKIWENERFYPRSKVVE